MNDDDCPPHLDAEETLMWKAGDGFVRSMLRRVSIARAETEKYKAALVQIGESYCECRADASDVANDALGIPRKV